MIELAKTLFYSAAIHVCAAVVFALVPAAGCGGKASPMPENPDATIDAAAAPDATSSPDGGSSGDAAPAGVDWTTASAATVQGRHVRRAGWAAGVYLYRIGSGALWRFVPGVGGSYYDVGTDERAATDWEILP